MRLFAALSEALHDQPKLGAGVVFTDGKKILLIQRSEESDHPGTWGIPGGRAKTGETPVKTAHRESKEEVGVAPNGKPFAKFDVADGDKHFHVFLFAVENTFKCTLSDEHVDYKWVELSRINRQNLHPKLEKSLPKYKKAIADHFGVDKSFKTWISGKDYP